MNMLPSSAWRGSSAPRAAAAVAGALLLGASVLRGQSLPQRVAAVRDGVVRLSYAVRPGVCGDGDDALRAGNGITIFRAGFGRNGDGMSICYTGPVRVSLRREAGETVSLRVHVGGRWPAGDTATDLGTVPSSDAARYFLGEAERLAGSTAGNALDAAAVADSVSLWPDLGHLARNTAVREDTRKRAVFWLATYEEPAAHDAVRAIVSDAALDEGVRGAAIIALARDDISDEDIRFLRAQYPDLSPKLRDDVFLAVSRSDSPSATTWLAGVVTDTAESTHERKQALFWLGQGRAATSELVQLYPKLHESDLRRHYTFVLSQRRDPAALDALMDVAQHDSDRDVRRQALFWIGQSHDARAVQFLERMVLR